MQGMLSTLSQVQHYAGNVVYTVTGTLVQHTDDSVQVVGHTFCTMFLFLHRPTIKSFTFKTNFLIITKRNIFKFSFSGA